MDKFLIIYSTKKESLGIQNVLQTQLNEETNAFPTNESFFYFFKIPSNLKISRRAHASCA